MSEIRIGPCGYGYYRPPENWKQQYESKLQAYAAAYRLGELDRPFYKLPMVRTARRWRREAGEEFVFALKAWQAITHPAGSLTWRKYRARLTEHQEKSFGYFNPNDPVFEAWEQTRAVAEALQATVCIFQTPGSFNFTKDNEINMRRFFGQIDRGNLDLGWEPRGDGQDHPDRIRNLCDDLHLIPVVDLLRQEPVSGHPVAYIRLHGLNEYPYDYNYKYSEMELHSLADRLRDLADTHRKVYCLFNNFHLYENTDQLREML